MAIADWLTQIHLGASYVKSENLITNELPRIEKGDQLIYTPIWNSHLNLTTSKNRLTAATQFRYTSSARGINENIDPYFLVSMQLGYKFPILSLAQTTADFESFNLAQDTFLNGSDGSAGFDNGNIHLPNSYNEEWSSWSGWAISSMTDTATPGFTNQYSSISGGGADGSATYATTFVLGETLLSTTGIGKGVVDGFYINNATYAYLSMRDGDAFAKKFGGEMGTDPDFFYVSIKEHGRRNVNNDSLIYHSSCTLVMWVCLG